MADAPRRGIARLLKVEEVLRRSRRNESQHGRRWWLPLRRRGTAVEGVASSRQRTRRRQVSVRKGNEEDTFTADKGDERCVIILWSELRFICISIGRPRPDRRRIEHEKGDSSDFWGRWSPSRCMWVYFQMDTDTGFFLQILISLILMRLEFQC